MLKVTKEINLRREIIVIQLFFINTSTHLFLGQSYRLALIHRPSIGLIRVKIYAAGILAVDSGNIIDNGKDSFKGGRLGVYCDSQGLITWSALTYRYRKNNITNFNQ